MTIGEIYDAIKTLERWELQREQLREKLRNAESMGAMDLAKAKQLERGLTADIEHLRAMVT